MVNGRQTYLFAKKIHLSVFKHKPVMGFFWFKAMIKTCISILIPNEPGWIFPVFG